MLDLIIVGGGVHGTALSNILTAAGAVGRDELLVIDGSGDPLSEWQRTTAAVGMTHLRSPSSHNLEVPLQSLTAFAKSSGRSAAAHLIGPYLRPSLDLWNDHASHVIATKGLAHMRCRARVERIEIGPDRICAVTAGGTYCADKMILAVGAEGGLETPGWVEPSETLCHVFDTRFSLERFLESERPVVVGGGISAVQLALLYGRPRTVLVAPHPIRSAQFDSEPCYIGPDCLEGFASITDPAERGKVISAKRNPGAVFPELLTRLGQEIANGHIEYVHGEVVSRRASCDGMHLLEIEGRERTGRWSGRNELRADLVVAATGLPSVPVEGGLVDRTAKEYRLLVDSLGRPVCDEALRWEERLFVCGRAGELTLGPAAPNIIGAHLAARRLVPFLLSGRSDPADPWTPI